MEQVIKKYKNVLGLQTNIRFTYEFEYDEKYQLSKDYDTGNEEEKIDNILNTLTDDKLKELNNKYPIYFSLSILFFKELKHLREIEFENNDSIFKVYKKDIEKHL